VFADRVIEHGSPKLESGAQPGNRLLGRSVYIARDDPVQIRRNDSAAPKEFSVSDLGQIGIPAEPFLSTLYALMKRVTRERVKGVVVDEDLDRTLCRQ